MTEPTPTTTYQNNPFMIALDGLNLFFKLAQSVAIFAIVLAVLGAGGNSLSPSGGSTDNQTNSQNITDTVQLTPETWAVLGVVVGILIIAFFIIGVIIEGIFDFTSARLANNQTTTIKQAFSGVIKRLPSYVWLRVIILVRVLLWSLLLIIPGIIMSVRYTLAGTSFFAEDLKGTAAIKRSLTLTRGAWLTTFGAHSLFNMITLGIIQPVLGAGTNALLYRQYSALGDTPKPAAHPLSWVALIIPIVVTLLIALVVFLFAHTIMNYMDDIVPIDIIETSKMT